MALKHEVVVGVLGVAVAGLGWILPEFRAEFIDKDAVLYTETTSGDRLTATVENLTDNQLNNVSFGFICDVGEACFEPDSLTVQRVAPHDSRITQPYSYEDIARITTTLPVGAKLKFSVKRAGDAKGGAFNHIPEDGIQDDFQLIERNSWRGWLVAKYAELLFWGLLVLAALLLIFGVIRVGMSIRKKERP